MKQLLVLAFFFSIQSCSFVTSDLNKESRTVIESLNQNWSFALKEEQPITVNLPHTPKIEPLVVNDQWQGIHTYTKLFNIQNPGEGATIIHFEGVMHDATVYVNDVEVKRHLGGYLPFSVDLSKHIKDGQNELRVEVSNEDNVVIPPGKPLSGLDFNYYGGIYRDVWIIRKNDIYITDPFVENTSSAGWLIHFDDISHEKAKGFIRLQLKNESKRAPETEVKVSLTYESIIHSFTEKVSLNQSETKDLKIPIEILNPSLWSTTSPSLYDLSVEITAGGLVYDQIIEKVGIRKIELTKDGFFLNGEKQFIRGTNRHQEYPYIGYAISNNANFRDALKIKNAGFDLVRLSHYPQDKSFLDACDELGLLAMNAIPGWQHFEEGDFVENSYQDIRDMIRRDRNHPSVVFWEVSLNESGMTEEYMKTANDILKNELPFQDTYSAGWIDHPSYDLFIPARQHAKPPYYWNDYMNGTRNIFIAEYGDWEYYAHNAGFNQTAFEDLSDEERNSRQLRAYGEQRLLQQALNFQEAANSNRKGLSGTIGHANWLMFDYNRGYANDLEASGISDIFRIPKFAYYFYKSQRPPTEEINHPMVDQGPMVKIASYWTEESPTNVRVYSNCEQIELYLNDSLIGVKDPTINQFSDHLAYPPFEFVVDHFEPGKLMAIGLIDGTFAVKDSVSTPGEPTNIRLSIDSLRHNTEELEDVFFVYAEITDSEGNLVPTASHKITFELQGYGELIGENPINAEAGIATILFKGELSTNKVTASSDQRYPLTLSMTN
ncbi:MAG: glycoside hydrolase family 2 TIM barrel-domain containing protein [Bacteroidota bacterium]